MSKNIIHSMTRPLVTLITLMVLSGCAISPEKMWRLDDKPLVDKKNAALLGVGNSKAFPNNIITRWTYRVKLINGKPFPKGKVFVQLDPGEYTVTVACGARFAPQDLGWFEGEHTTKIRVDAGEIYWAWIGARQDGYRMENGLTYTTAGRCWVNEFNSRNPFVDVAG